MFKLIKRIDMSGRAKIIIDILMVIGFIAAALFSKQQNGEYVNIWTSPHCIVSALWVLLILIHILQHYPLIKAFARRKVIVKNKITFITFLFTIMMIVSILFFMAEVNVVLLHVHGIVGRLFVLLVIIHVINKYRQFVRLWKR